MRLHLYFARRFLTNFSGVFMVFFGILMLIDIAEQLRRFGALDLGLRDLLALSALNVPATLYQILPLVTILATLALFLGLARSSELVVTRAAGRSAMRALISPVLVALLVGCAAVAVFNPIVAATSSEYERRVNAVHTGVPSALSLSGQGLWLRQGSSAPASPGAGETLATSGTGEETTGPGNVAAFGGQTVIYARETSLDGTRLRGVSFISFRRDGVPARRIEAAVAALETGFWQLRDVKIWDLTPQTGAGQFGAGQFGAGLPTNPQRGATEATEFTLPTDLTQEQIQDSFALPSAIPVWELPGFITQLEDAGFTARAHRVFLLTELALPLMLVSMVLLGAGFTMRHVRFGQTGVMVLFAILLGFSLYFLRNFARVLGENGHIPAELAALAPPSVAIFLSLGLLLHLEDG